MVPKTVLITGTSEGGIGDALAKLFHRKGLRVFATARNLAKVEHLKELGIEVLRLDVVDAASIKEVVEEIKTRTGGTLDYLVNNSGRGYSVPLIDADMQTVKDVFELNVFALMAVTQAFIPLLIAAKGTVVNIGSIAAISPVPWQGWYNASKSAVAMISDNLRLELVPFDVKVIQVVTGGIKTKFFDNLPAQTLPPNSYYIAAKETIDEMINGSSFKDQTMDVDQFAKAVVDNALKSKPKVHLWAGTGAFGVWFIHTFAWATIWDIALAKLVKMPLIKSKIQAAAKA